MKAKETGQQWNGHRIHYGDDPCGIVLGLPNSGMAMASVISELLRIPAHVFIAQNLWAPCRCPCVIGALTEANIVHMDERVIARQQWPYRELRAYIERETQKQRAEIAHQRELLRAGKALPDLTKRHVLFVDDGTAPSAMLIASIESFRKLGAAKVVAVMPADSLQMSREIERHADELVDSMPFGLYQAQAGSGLNSPVHQPLVH